MQPVTGIKEIINAEKAVAENMERGAGQIAKKISDSWALTINLTGAIDSGDYLRSVNFHPVQTSGGLLEHIIDTSDDSDVNYAGFVEGGTKYMPARYPAQKAIEREDFVSTVERLVEDALEKGSE